jgi:hypothetical protein
MDQRSIRLEMDLTGMVSSPSCTCKFDNLQFECQRDCSYQAFVCLVLRLDILQGRSPVDH